MVGVPHIAVGIAVILIITRAAPWAQLPLARKKTLHGASTVLSVWSVFNTQQLFLVLYQRLSLATGAASARWLRRHSEAQVHGQAWDGLRSVLRCHLSNGITYEHQQCSGVRKHSLKGR